MPPRGSFIVIEGLDRSGKSTQSSLLFQRFTANGSPVTLIKFPDRSTSIGKLIDSYLRSETEMDDHAIHLLFSANRWQMASQITTLLNAGTTIICDRYAFSGIAFSASKSISSSCDPPSVIQEQQHRELEPPRLTYEWCRAPDISLPAPDLTLFLDINPEQAAKERTGYGLERYEKIEMQVRVRSVFERIGQEMGKDKWVKIDAALSKDEVADRIWRAIIERLGDGIEGPVGRLWEDLL